MHEAGFAQQVIEACSAALRSRGGVLATSVGIRVDPLSAFDPEALRLSFDALKPGTPLHSAVLRIDRLAATDPTEDAFALDIGYLEFEET